jgi:hypothetical protein
MPRKFTRGHRREPTRLAHRYNQSKTFLLKDVVSIKTYHTVYYFLILLSAIMIDTYHASTLGTQCVNILNNACIHHNPDFKENSRK